MRRRRANATLRGPTARFTGPFHFFDLPGELRDMIYGLAWPATPNLYRATFYERPSPLIDITTHYGQEADGWLPVRKAYARITCGTYADFALRHL